MKSLDLFTGIGGMTHGLRGLGIQPAAYCEADDRCQKVLVERIRTRDLPSAPIHTDIRGFPAKQYAGVDIVCAGFPCTGFSTGGKRKGFKDSGSGLYHHLLRVIDDCKTRHVFLENVPEVYHSGVIADMSKRGYAVSWVTLCAYHVGSPQKRQRWFCLASKSSKDVLRASRRVEPFRWHKENAPRMLANPEDATRRLNMLGNTVVPDVARVAFLTLWTHGITAPEAFGRVVFPRRFPDASHTDPKAKPHLHGAIIGGAHVGLPMVTGLRVLSPNQAIHMLPDSHIRKGAPNPRQVHKTRADPVALQCWATPRASLTAPCQVLTARTQKDLPTQLRFEKNTPDADRALHVNPDWVEWLQGYRTGWTTASAPK